MHQVQQYFKSYDFHRGVLMAFTMLVNGLLFYYLNLTDLIPAVAIGILLTSMGDLQGDLNRRVWTMLFSILLNVTNFIIINSLMEITIVQFLYIAMAVFFISYLSVFGHRANMLAFSGLMGIVLSMVKKYDGFNMWEYVIFMAVGGLCYITFSTIFHFITKKSQVNEKLLELMKLTGQYIEIQFNRNQSNNTINEQERLNLHQQIIEKQDGLRNLLFTNELFGGSSKTRNRQMLLLVELIDISELAKANPINITKLRNHPHWKEELFEPFQHELYQHAQWLKEMARTLEKGTSLRPFNRDEASFSALKEKVVQFAFENGIEKVRPISLALFNYHDYLEKQLSKIKLAYRLVKNKNIREQKSTILNYREKFTQSEDYSLRGFRESFRLSSPIMRHSIRITVAILVGYLIGWLLNVQNAYWIMLTVVVIMRPSYGLTKSRSVQRVTGTIVGVIVAIGVVLFTANIYVYLVLALVSMIFAFSLINRNYFLASAAITLNVIFAFAMILPDQWGVIQYRFIDTLIGAGVCTVVGYTILPYWEYKNLKENMVDTINANKMYMQSIIQFYKNPTDDIDYRLSRKRAFAAAGELNAAFQDFTQDPKSKQKNAEVYYDWLVMNQSYLSSLANLGSYIQNHHSAKIQDGFEHAMNYLYNKLRCIGNTLEQKPSAFKDVPSKMIEEYWTKLEQKRNEELAEGKFELNDELRLELQEVKHIKEELEVLDELAEKLYATTVKIFNKSPE